MINIIYKQVALLPLELQIRFRWLLIVVIFSALFEVVGIASIIPFIAIIQDPSILSDSQHYMIVEAVNLFSSEQFIILTVGLILISIFIISQISKSYSQFFMFKFALSAEYQISSKLLKKYLDSDYEWLLSKSETELGKNVLAQVSMVINNSLLPSVHFVAYSIYSVFLISFLILLDPLISAISVFILAFIFILVFFGLRKKLRKIGEESIAANNTRFKIINDIFLAIKELKINALEDFAVNRFKTPAIQFASTHATEQILRVLPRYLVESVVFLMLVISILLSHYGVGLTVPIATIAAFAFAGFRLLPALQQIYSASNQILFAEQALRDLELDLQRKASLNYDLVHQNLNFQSKIQFQNISYKYEGANHCVLEDVDFTIHNGSKIGIIGETGSGKSTLIDLFTGLIQPTQGKIIIDNVHLDKSRLRSWQRKISYISQKASLSDATIRDNLSFNNHNIRQADTTLLQLCDLVELGSFVRNNDIGLDYYIGEDGKLLSGGQRQRLTIARALAKDAEILVFDEATSALDLKTERSLMENILNAYNDKTILMITHRQESLSMCDRVIKVSNRSIKFV